MEASDPGEVLQRDVLAGLCWTALQPDEVAERFIYALARVQTEYFSADYQAIWLIITRFYSQIGVVPTYFQFNELLAGSTRLNLERKAQLSQIFTELIDVEIGLPQFRFSVQRLGVRWRDLTYAQSLASSSRILSSTFTPPGEKRSLSGFDDSLAYLRERLAQLSTHGQIKMPEGDINLEGRDFLRRYYKKKQTRITGILSGLPILDELTGGLQNGELMLIAGFTSEGKSKLSYNLAYSACYQQAKNVVFIALEVGREQVERNFIVRHSHAEQFGIPAGIRYDRVRRAQLDEQEEQKLHQIVEDIETGTKAGRYGHLDVFQLPERSPVSDIRDRVARISRAYPVDVVFVDYLGLMGSSSRRNNRREELDDLLVSAKRLALDTNEGKGVPVISPWQISRAAWESAQKSGNYTKASLAETAQAERSPDLILSILKPSEGSNVLRAQVLKYRDGSADIEFSLTTDFATSLVQQGEFGTTHDQIESLLR